MKLSFRSFFVCRMYIFRNASDWIGLMTFTSNPCSNRYPYTLSQ